MTPVEKVKNLGKVGRILSLLFFFLLIGATLLLCMMSIFIQGAFDSLFGEFSFFDYFVISFDSTNELFSSLLDVFDFLFISLGLWFAYKIFDDFSKGFILTKKVANYIIYFGIWCILCQFDYSYDYSKTQTGPSSYKISESSSFTYELTFILPSLLFIALGFVIHYATEIKEENQLTI